MWIYLVKQLTLAVGDLNLLIDHQVASCSSSNIGTSSPNLPKQEALY